MRLETLASRRATVLALLAVAVLYLGSFLLIEKQGFWIIDNANKFLQLQAIRASGYTDYSIPWPGAIADPEYHFNPLPPPFSIVADGKLYSQYSPIFATISSLPYSLFGMRGLYLLPLLGALLLLIGVARLASFFRDQARGIAPLAVLLTGLATPVWFYSQVFWEHTLAVCACVWAAFFALRFLSDRRERNLVAACSISVAGIYLREELLLFHAVLLLLLIQQTTAARGRVAAIGLAGSVFAFLPWLIFHWAAVGTPLGHHVGANVWALKEHLSSRPLVLYRLFAAAGRNWLPSLLLTAPFVGLLVWHPRIGEHRFSRAFPLLALLAAAAALVSFAGYFLGPGPIPHMMSANSLFPAAPIILLGLLRSAPGRDGHPARRIWWLVIGFALLYALAAPPVSSRGIHWGNRFLLGSYPFLALLAAVNLARWTTRRRGASSGTPGLRWLVVAPVIAVSLIAQVYSLCLLDAKQDYSRRLNEAVRARSEPAIVANTWWTPQALFSVFYERPIFYARSASELEPLERLLREEGHDMVLLVRRPRPGAPPRPGTTVIRDGPLGDTFTLTLAAADIGVAPNEGPPPGNP